MPSTSGAKSRVERFRSLIDESQSVRSKYEPVWDQGLRRYLGDQWDRDPPAGLQQFVLNRLQNAVIASVAVQTEQPPRIRLEPRETDDPPLFFASDSAMQKAASIGEVVNADPVTGVVDEAEVQRLMAITQPAPGMVPAGPEGEAVEGEVQQPLFTPEDFIAVDDQTATRELQTIVDAVWERTDMDFSLMENVLNKSVFGTQPMLVEWDERRHLPVQTNVHIKNVWIDPLARGIEDARWIILAEVMSAAEAKKRFPKIDPAKIDEAAEEGFLADATGQGGNYGYQLGSPYQDTDFGRNMVTLWTLWQRDIDVPMDPADAVEQGLISPVMDEDGVEQEGTFELPDGRLTAPDDDLFPTEPGVMLSQFLAEEEVLHQRAPVRDLPFGWNINIPIPYRPWGQGDPERAEDLQQAVNRVASILHNWIRYYQSAQIVMPKSVADHIDPSQLFARPDKRWIVPDEVIFQFGTIPLKDLITFVEPPALPNDAVEILRILLEEYDREMGFQDVLQGEAKSGASGELVKALQSAARGPLGYQSKHTERLIRQVVRLWIEMCLNFMPETEWGRYTSSPVQVQRAIRNRLKSLEVDTGVEIISGKGANREATKQEFRELYQMGTLSGGTLNEIHNVPDPQGEVQRRTMEMAVMAPPETEGGGEGQAT